MRPRTLVGAGVHGQDIQLEHQVHHDGQDALLHLAGVLGAQDDHLAAPKVQGDAGGRGHALGVAVGREAAGIVDDVVCEERGWVGRHTDTRACTAREKKKKEKNDKDTKKRRTKNR